MGDRPTETTPEARKRVFRELLVLWLGTLLLIRVVVAVQDAGLPEWILALVPFLFIYAPVALCRYRRVDSYAYHLSVPPFRSGRAWWSAAKVGATWLLVLMVPFLIGYHVYQTQIFDLSPDIARLAPRRLDLDLGGFLLELQHRVIQNLSPQGERILATTNKHLTLLLYQVFFVAIPEEFFYRGYMQTRLNEVFPRKFIIMGIPFGHALWITALVFAVGHSLVMLRWWHWAIFFPGLLFGLLRERTRGILAGAFFHAGCNILVVNLDTIYGILPP